MDKQKKRISKWNLYQKEQLLITIILLCFVLSGMWFPKIKSHFIISPIVNIETPEEPILENTPTTDTNNKNDYTENTTSKNEEKTDNTPQKPNVESGNQNEETNSQVNDQAQTPETPQIQKPETQKPQTQKPQTLTPEKPAPLPTEDQKEWVPPVYETIHHDAVYETKRVAICNYCGEIFDNVGDFQVHKNENGG